MSPVMRPSCPGRQCNVISPSVSRSLWPDLGFKLFVTWFGFQFVCGQFWVSNCLRLDSGFKVFMTCFGFQMDLWPDLGFSLLEVQIFLWPHLGFKFVCDRIWAPSGCGPIWDSRYCDMTWVSSSVTRFGFQPCEQIHMFFLCKIAVGNAKSKTR